MSVLILLIGASLIVALGFLFGFIWSVKNGQFDDDYTPSVRMLFDEETKAASGLKIKQSSSSKTIKKVKQV